MAVQEEAEFSVVSCEILSATALRKKGHVLLELRHPSVKSLQIVTDRADAIAGFIAIVAMAGAVLKNGEVVKQRKVAREWSQAVLIDLVEVSSVSSLGSQAIESGDDSNHCDEEAACQIGESCGCTVLPCVIGETTATGNGNATDRLHRVAGDAAMASYGKGPKIIVNVCNDQGRWGKGFVKAITDRWGRHPGKMYRQWHKAGADAGFGLGAAQLVTLSPTMSVANMIGQNGKKTSSKGPPVRYNAIREALSSVCAHAAVQGASLHMPRIGSEYDGNGFDGSGFEHCSEFGRIEAIILSVMSAHAVDVYIYDYKCWRQ